MLWCRVRLMCCVCAAALLASMAGACAHALHWAGLGGHTAQGVNQPDGSGTPLLHRLAAAGLAHAVAAFVVAAGPALDLGQRDGRGLTALEVAG